MTKRWAATALALIPLLLRRQLWVVSVAGDSMFPTLREGMTVICEKDPAHASLRRGEVVLVRWRPDPTWTVRPILWSEDRYDIKRLAALEGDEKSAFDCGDGTVPTGHCLVLSDSPSGIDSRKYGPIALADVCARVVYPRLERSTKAHDSFASRPTEGEKPGSRPPA